MRSADLQSSTIEAKKIGYDPKDLYEGPYSEVFEKMQSYLQDTDGEGHEATDREILLRFFDYFVKETNKEHEAIKNLGRN